MLVLIGKTCSGKDTIANELIRNYGYKKLVTYTTRPMRDGEIQDVTYHFISTDEFIEKIRAGFFAEWKDYVTNSGLWYYGTALKDCEAASDNNVSILTPSGVRDLRKYNVKTSVFYIQSDLNTTRQRLYSRGDDTAEIERRIMADLEDFKDAEMLADKIIYNNSDDHIKNVANKVAKWHKKLLRRS